MPKRTKSAKKARPLFTKKQQAVIFAMLARISEAHQIEINKLKAHIKWLDPDVDNWAKGC